MARKKKLDLNRLRKDLMGTIENEILVKAWVEVYDIFWMRDDLPPTHPDFAKVRQLKLQAAKLAINGYIGLRNLGIQQENQGRLSDLLKRMKQHDALLSPADRAELHKLIQADDGAMVPASEIN